MPLRGLLSEEYAATRRALITETAATGPGAAGDPYPFEGGQGPHAETTTHLTTSDKSGNVVSYTFTIESTGGRASSSPATGSCSTTS